MSSRPLELGRVLGRRRFAHGAELAEDGASFRLWAPGRAEARIVLEDGREAPLFAAADGWFGGRAPGLLAGTRYGFRVDGGPLLADPASRAQDGGPDGWSVLVDPAAYSWSDRDWPGVRPAGQVIYELHVGTFTPEGTWAAAAGRLAHLAALGITIIEMLPIAEFRGQFGWGYDGALTYAPSRLYGTPDEFRRFVDAAHSAGISVILDVVYNHFGPGNRFHDLTADWFTDRYKNDWGASLNFDGPGSAAVRDYVAQNAAYWIAEYHLDGLRLDATQALFDASADHIVARLAREARAAAGGRRVYIVAENEPQDARLSRPPSVGGYGLDSLWNDDFHHSAQAALTGRSEAYYHDYKGAPQEFVALAKFGHLFQGQRYDWQDAPRGTPSRDLPASAFVTFTQNHDQIANSARGLRSHALAAPARLRALTALLLLGPQTPMLFQGQEFWSSSPFLFFADQGEDLDPLVSKGRADFMRQFASLNDPAANERMAPPAHPETFARCKLDWAECTVHGEAMALHRDLLRLRRETKAIASQPSGPSGGIDGSVIGPAAFLLRYFADDAPEEERLILVNFGADLPLPSIPDPLFAPPVGFDWHVIWSSEDRVYGGGGRRPVQTGRRLTLTGDCALLLAPGPRHPSTQTSDLVAWQTEIG